MRLLGPDGSVLDLNVNEQDIDLEPIETGADMVPIRDFLAGALERDPDGRYPNAVAMLQAFDEAMEKRAAIERSAGLPEEQASHFAQRGIFLGQAGDDRGALADFDRAIALLQDWEGKTEWSRYAQFNLGVALVRSGREEYRYRNLSLVLVPPDLPGVQVNPIEHQNLRYTLSSDVIFEDVEVPIENVFDLKAPGDRGRSGATYGDLLFDADRQAHAFIARLIAGEALPDILQDMFHAAPDRALQGRLERFAALVLEIDGRIAEIVEVNEQVRVELPFARKLGFMIPALALREVHAELTEAELGDDRGWGEARVHVAPMGEADQRLAAEVHCCTDQHA